MTLAPERVLFPRGLCFSVVGDGGGGWAVLTAANRHCSSKVGGWGLPGSRGAPLSGSQSLEGGSGPGSREAGLQFRNWKNLGGTGGSFGISTHRGTGCLRQRVPSRRAGSPPRGSSSGPALGRGTRPTQPSQCTLPPLHSEKAAAGAV